MDTIVKLHSNATIMIKEQAQSPSFQILPIKRKPNRHSKIQKIQIFNKQGICISDSLDGVIIWNTTKKLLIFAILKIQQLKKLLINQPRQQYPKDMQFRSILKIEMTIPLNLLNIIIAQKINIIDGEYILIQWVMGKNFFEKKLIKCMRMDNGGNLRKNGWAQNC